MFENLDRILRQTIYVLFLTLFFFLPLIFWIPNSEVFELPKMYFVYAMTALITGLWLARMVVRREIMIKRTPLDIPILLFLVSQIASTIYSIDPHISWFGWYGRFNGGLLSTISYTLLYYALVANTVNSKQLTVNGKRDDNSIYGLPFTVYPIIASAIIVSIYALLQHFEVDKDFWVQDVATRVFSTQGQPNWLAAYLIMIIPIVWTAAISDIRFPRPRLGSAEGGQNSDFQKTAFLNLKYEFLFLIFFLALLFTKSRSGLLGFAVADVVFWGLIFTKARPSVGRPGLNWSVIHLGIFLLVLITNNPVRDWFSKTIQPVENQSEQSAINNQQLTINNLRKSELGGTESGDIRRLVWSGAMEIAKQNPMFGIGPETFGLTYWQVRPKEANQTSEWNFLYNKAHNEWLNLAANTGLFGLGAHLLLLGWFSIWVLKGPALPQRQGRALLNYAILAGLLGVETVNFFGFSTVTVGTYSYLFMAMAAAAAAKSKEQRAKSKERTNAFSSFIDYCLLFMVFFSTFYLLFQISRLFLADLKYNLGRQFYSAGYAAEALEPLSQTVNLAPNEPVFRNELAETQAMLAISLSAETLAQSSLANFKIVSGQSKYNLIFTRTQAQMEFLMREIDPNLTGEALLLAQKAIDLSPTDPRGYYLLGRMYGELGDKSKAENLYRQALELKPDYEEAIKILNTEY